jgi:phospholipid/cholesterol/gamma-HCH transport system substrate-binding protein
MADSRGLGREVVVGSIVLVALGIFVGGTFWLSGKTLFTPDGVKILFEDAGDLKRASPVRVSGVPVGKVQDIKLLEPGKVEVTISLPDYIEPKTDALAYIRTVGLAGDVALVFVPGTDPTPLPKGQVVQSVPVPTITDMAGKLTGSADTLLTSVRALVGPERREQLDRTLERLNSTLTSTQALLALYADQSKGPTAELQATLVQFRALAAKLDTNLSAPSIVRARDKADTLVTSLNDMSVQFRATGQRLDSVLAKLERGEGTMGKLATDTLLYHRFTDLSASVDSLVRDLRKNPGKLGVTVKMF